MTTIAINTFLTLDGVAQAPGAPDEDHDGGFPHGGWQDLGELLVIGSLDLAQTLIRHNLVDEYRLLVYLVLLGTGKRLFAGGTVPAGLKLVSTETTGAGATASVFRPAGPVSYGSFGL